MLTEEKIYRAWKKRFAYPESSLEKKAGPDLKNGMVRKISARRVENRVARSRLIVFGDDASNPLHQILVAELLMVHRRKKIVLLSNRDAKQVRALKKCLAAAGIAVRIRKISERDLAMVRGVEMFQNRFELVVLWTGHLRVVRPSFRNSFRNLSVLFVGMQINPIRWAYPDVNGWVEINQDFVANTQTSALLTVDRLRAADEGMQIVSPSDVKQSFRMFTLSIATILGQKKMIKPKHIFSVFDQKDISAFQKTNFSSATKNFISKRMLQGESAVMPAIQAVVIGSLNPSHIAEEAAHQLRTGSRDSIRYATAGIVVEEGLAFFASLLLFPTRLIPTKIDLSSGLSGKAKYWNDVHAGGYALGARLYRLWKTSKKFHEPIRQLWIMYPGNESENKIMLTMMLNLK